MAYDISAAESDHAYATPEKLSNTGNQVSGPGTTIAPAASLTAKLIKRRPRAEIKESPSAANEPAGQVNERPAPLLDEEPDHVTSDSSSETHPSDLHVTALDREPGSKQDMLPPVTDALPTAPRKRRLASTILKILLAFWLGAVIAMLIS